MVSLLEKTPSERMALTRQHRIAEASTLRKGKRKELISEPVGRSSLSPEEFVRVKFYVHLKRLSNGARSDFDDYFQLEYDGSLDMTKVMKRWNLESCVPVCPRRYEAINNTTPILSPVAVRVLSAKGSIKVIEPKISPQTQFKRALRDTTMAALLSLLSTFITITNHSVNKAAIVKSFNKASRWVSDLVLAFIMYTVVGVCVLGSLSWYYQARTNNTAISSSSPPSGATNPNPTTDVATPPIDLLLHLVPSLALKERFQMWARTGGISL